MKPIIFMDMTLTQWLIVLGVIFYSLYDFFAKVIWGDDETITFTFQKWSEEDYRIAVIAAILFAHVFLTTHRHG